MSEKIPQPTKILIHRLRRVAKYHDTVAGDFGHPADKARANTCWQSAARLEELHALAKKSWDVSDEGELIDAAQEGTVKGRK